MPPRLMRKNLATMVKIRQRTPKKINNLTLKFSSTFLFSEGGRTIFLTSNKIPIRIRNSPKYHTIDGKSSLTPRFIPPCRKKRTHSVITEINIMAMPMIISHLAASPLSLKIESDPNKTPPLNYQLTLFRFFDYSFEQCLILL
jgi:hypothetical protein